MQRTITVGNETLTYILTIKRVKNLNLRVKADGTLAVSAPRYVPMVQIDTFVASRAAWIEAARQRAALCPAPAQLPPCNYTDAECAAALGGYVAHYTPLFAKALGGKPPVIVYRTMKSRWGVCCPAKRRITLNRRLLDKSPAAQDYVVAHEFVHFEHPNHGKGFYAALEKLVPDYKERKKELRSF